VRFRYARAHSLGEAIDLLEKLGPAHKPLAGGTDLLTSVRRGRLAKVEGVVDLWRVEELRGVERRREGTWVGPLTTHAKIASDPLLSRTCPGLAEASSKVGSPQIRNRGTLGGNVVNASPCADTLPPLVVAEAELELVGASGTRRLAVEDFVIGPYDTRLAPGEVVAGLILPVLRPGGRWAHVRLGRREALDRARMSVCAAAWLGDDGRIEEVRLAAGAVLPKPRRLREAETALQKAQPSARLFAEAAADTALGVVEEAGRRWSAPYKEKALAALLKRALMHVCELNEEADE
jgi:CO/xanthine dehydrogenase FAD-binding subunit